MKAALSTGYSVIFIFPYRYKSESVLCPPNLESFQYDYNDFQLFIYLACYAHFSPSQMLVRCTRAEVSWCRNWRVNKLRNSMFWPLRPLATGHVDVELHQQIQNSCLWKKTHKGSGCLSVWSVWAIYVFLYILSILKLQAERCSKLSVVLRVGAKERQNTMEKADSIANDQRNEEKVTAVQRL